MADSTPLSQLAAGETLFVVRTVLVREPAILPHYGGDVVRGPKDVHAIAAALLDGEPQEVFVAFLLNTRHNITAYHVITRGILDASLVHARELFRSAIIGNAAGIVLVHNHPSGNPSPSPEDRAVTRMMAEAGRIVGIPVIDHLVIGSGTGTYVSLATEIT